MPQTPNALHVTNPTLEVVGGMCVLKGSWVIAAIKSHKQLQELQRLLQQGFDQRLEWDLRAIQLDHFWGDLLWKCWGQKIPAQARLTDEQQDLFERIQKNTVQLSDIVDKQEKNGVFAGLGYGLFAMLGHARDFTQLLGAFVLDCWLVIKAPSRAPWKDFAGQVMRMGAQALPITGLVGLLIGVVIVYLLGGFLQKNGLGLYIINAIGLMSIRELGPMLAAILVAGRSGSTITAQVGVMRLREELDAMHVLGISATYRLVLPRVWALGLTMPMISMWTSLLAIFGGMIVADLSMDISYGYFIKILPSTLSVSNIWMNIGKSVVFGMLIALIGCYFGLRVKSDTESLGNGTTASVVASITAVILADAVFAILCRNVPI